MFPNYEISLNLNDPSQSIEQINTILNKIEHNCPVGKYFGQTGSCEGIVWEFYTEGNIRYQFKTKTSKFLIVKPTKKKNQIIIDPETINSINDFLNYAITENRLSQGIREICQDSQVTSKHIRPFIDWVINDIQTEEIQTITKNNLPQKELNCEIANKAREYILNIINQ